MRNRTYIRTEKPVFKIDSANRVVVCTLKCDMQLYKHPAWRWIDSEVFKKKLPYIDYDGCFEVKAKARCNSTDTFDEETGKRIAESRAKAKMFRTAEKVYKLCTRHLLKLLASCSWTQDNCNQARLVEEDHIHDLTV